MTAGRIDGLVQVRWVLIAAQVALAVWALALGEAEHRPWALLGVSGLLAAAELLPAAPFTRAVTDLAALAALQAAWGPHYPLQPLALVELVLVATVSPPRQAWALTALAVGLPVLDAALQARLGEDALHLVSHVGSAAVAAVSLGWFSQRLGAALRAGAAARQAAEAERERAARLAVVGTLAAGVAHELATPLGSIELLAEEADLELGPGPGRDALVTLRAQVRRCRGILDRVLSRGEPQLRRCAVAATVRSAVAAWQQAGVGRAVAVSGGEVPEAIGDEGTWTAALWTLLDNAERAGGATEVGYALDGAGVRVWVDDQGPGPDAEAVARAGEPFYTRWGPGARPGPRGTGLGLYAVRSGLDAVGGRFVLGRRPGGGGRAELWLPVARTEVA